MSFIEYIPILNENSTWQHNKTGFVQPGSIGPHLTNYVIFYTSLINKAIFDPHVRCENGDLYVEGVCLFQGHEVISISNIDLSPPLGILRSIDRSIFPP